MDTSEYNQVIRKYGDKVRQFRKEAGYSQEKLAFECSLHRTNIGAIERGERNLTLRSMTKIAAILNKPITDFF